MSPAGPIIWPVGAPTPRYVPSSINVIDCQNQFLDLLTWPVDAAVENATLVYFNCQVLFPDMDHTVTQLEWHVNTASVYPCEVRRKQNILRGHCGTTPTPLVAWSKIVTSCLFSHPMLVWWFCCVRMRR